MCRWQTFEAFWEDMGQSWAEGLSIDRRDNNGNYEAGNCRWATPTEQSANKRNSVLLETPWGILTQSETARRMGVQPSVIAQRIRNGWPKELLFSGKLNRWSRRKLDEGAT